MGSSYDSNFLLLLSHVKTKITQNSSHKTLDKPRSDNIDTIWGNDRRISRKFRVRSCFHNNNIRIHRCNIGERGIQEGIHANISELEEEDDDGVNDVYLTGIVF